MHSKEVKWPQYKFTKTLPIYSSRIAPKITVNSFNKRKLDHSFLKSYD